MMIERGQQEMAAEFGLLPFQVNVLQPARTLCEKIMSLVRFSYSSNPLDDLKMKIRHVYDLHKMLEDKKLNNFFNSNEFDVSICRVTRDDVLSFRNNHEWLENHPADALLFREVKSCWNGLKATYSGDFSGLVYGEFPDEQKVFETLIRIKERLVTVDWDIGKGES